MMKRPPGPRIDACRGCIPPLEEIEEPFQTGINDAMRDGVVLQGTGQFRQTRRGFARFTNRRMNQENHDGFGSGQDRNAMVPIIRQDFEGRPVLREQDFPFCSLAATVFNTDFTGGDLRVEAVLHAAGRIIVGQPYKRFTGRGDRPVDLESSHLSPENPGKRRIGPSGIAYLEERIEGPFLTSMAQDQRRHTGQPQRSQAKAGRCRLQETVLVRIKTRHLPPGILTGVPLAPVVILGPDPIGNIVAFVVDGQETVEDCHGQADEAFGFQKPRRIALEGKKE